MPKQNRVSGQLKAGEVFGTFLGAALRPNNEAARSHCCLTERGNLDKEQKENDSQAETVRTFGSED